MNVEPPPSKEAVNKGPIIHALVIGALAGGGLRLTGTTKTFMYPAALATLSSYTVPTVVKLPPLQSIAAQGVLAALFSVALKTSTADAVKVGLATVGAAYISTSVISMTVRTLFTDNN